jgi:hypothetical protein
VISIKDKIEISLKGDMIADQLTIGTKQHRIEEQKKKY